MSENRLEDYLEHMHGAARDACSFVEGMDIEAFLEDKRTQQAVIMSLVIIGEAATKVMDRYAAFAQSHPEVPWQSVRGMRNRMTHGYFDISLDIVWYTVQHDPPAFRDQIQALVVEQIRQQEIHHDRGLER